MSSNVAVLAKIDAGEIAGADVARAMISISQVAEERMGGTSGALYSSVVSFDQCIPR